LFPERKFLKIYPFFFWLALLISLLLIYHSSFYNFFFGDDFYNLMLAKTDRLSAVVNFFNPVKAPLEFPFYRPLTTQFYFWLGEKLFNLNPLGYHIINFSFFFISIILVFYLTKLLLKDKLITYLTTFFYAFSTSHFYRLYFLTQFQELGLTVFYFLSVILYVLFRKSKRISYYFFSLIIFIVAITCKETAVTLPLILLLVELFFFKKSNFTKWLMKTIIYLFSYLFILLGYLYLRLAFFGFSQGNEYIFVFKLKSVVNNLLWYILWAIGIPENFVNVKLIDNFYLINPEFFTNFGREGAVVMPFFIIFIFFLLLGIKIFTLQIKEKYILKDIKMLLFAVFWFLGTIVLVMFFPFHKFSYSLALPLWGIALFLALLIRKLNNFSYTFFFMSLLIYLLVNISSSVYAVKNHWTVNRAKLAQKVFTYLEKNYLYFPNGSTICFSDSNMSIPFEDKFKTNRLSFSKELDDVLVGSKGIEAFYSFNNLVKTKNQDTKVLFEYNSLGNEDNKNNSIIISARQFFEN